LGEAFVAASHTVGAGEDDIEGITAAVEGRGEFEVWEVEICYCGDHDDWPNQLDYRLGRMGMADAMRKIILINRTVA
jgi:hypothetical protein